MKKLAVLTILISVFTFFPQAYCAENEIVIEYGEFEGRPVNLVYDPENKGLAFKMKSESGLGEKELAFMKQEAERIFSYTEPTTLPGGYIIVFMGGFPHWGPYSTYSSLQEDFYEIKCLHFARYAEIILAKNKTIYVYGESQRPDGYYPYSESVGRPF